MVKQLSCDLNYQSFIQSGSHDYLISSGCDQSVLGDRRENSTKMSEEAPVVDTKFGKIKGRNEANINGGEFLGFWGVPYAEPPLGPLRFKDPVPLQPWEGVRSIESKFPRPPQYDTVTNSFGGTEDCLYLNVATPSLEGKKPVMVWIHGGGFVMSTAYKGLYGPDYLMQHDVVFVSIGYRLGCFGFLNLNLPGASGNQGMKDQVAALKWVQENIEAFGGDPGNVTVFGNSAGAAAVHYLTLSPLSEGLFHKAIIMSGSACSPWSWVDNPMELGLRLASLTAGQKSIDHPKEALDILMKASTLELLRAQRRINPRDMDYELVFNFVPSMDTACPDPFMPVHPTELCKKGIRVPLIIGGTGDEGIILEIDEMFNTLNNEATEFLARTLGTRNLNEVEKVVDTVMEHYFGEPKVVVAKKDDQELYKLLGDVHFNIGIREAIEIQSDLSSPTWIYHYTYHAEWPTIRSSLFKYEVAKGAGHGDELGALFHSPSLAGSKVLQKGTSDYLMKERMTKMWTNFAKTGNPIPELDDEIPVKWKPMNKKEINYLEIGEELVIKRGFAQALWKFWKPIMDRVRTSRFSVKLH